MTDTAQHLSNRAYAKRRGVSEAVVRKWLSQGKIEKDPRTRKIDPASADAMLAKNISRLPNKRGDTKKNGDRKVNGKRVSLTDRCKGWLWIVAVLRVISPIFLRIRSLLNKLCLADSIRGL